MARIIACAFLCIALFTPSLVAQHFKLYPEPNPNTVVYTNRFNNNRDGISYRLPNETIAQHYNIHLTTRIDLPDFNFNGTVEITVFVVNNTRSITLHSKLQTIESVSLLSSANAVILTRTPVLDPVTEFLNIATETVELQAGSTYKLLIQYSSVLRTDDEGFYRSSYMGDNGERVWQAATQFQESDARHGFPCYDEPAIRTIFSIRITHGRSYHALCNMPVREIIENTDDTVTTVFYDTPSMQAYLVAFIISDFISISNNATKRPDELLQSVYGQPRAIKNGEGDFALEAGIKIMHEMEKYFGHNYTLPKMDQVGVPDFSAGAMENWGLVKYREMYLYYDNGTSPFQQLDWVATIISHEYAHTWFGNLISPLWWDVLWINEGFATMYEYLSTDAVYPEWRIHDLMVVNTLQTVMERDALPSSRPMTYYVENQKDVRSLFDFVAYSKSGCVLRMLQHVLTDATFRRGLNYYIEDMQDKASSPDDLYRNLLIAAREDNAIPNDVTIKQIMDSWANQMGFPMIYVSRMENGTLSVTQEHFLLQGTVPNQQTWWIPINFATRANPNFDQTTPMGWLQQGELSISLSSGANMVWTNQDWVVFNKHQTGYYRVNYDTPLWRQIVEELVDGNYSVIPVINRAQLIDDVYTFARVNQVPYSTVFGVMEYLSKELDYAPWAPAIRALTAIDRRMASLENYDQFKTFVHHKVQPLFDSLGVQNLSNDTYFDRLARNVAIQWACYVGSPECLEATHARLREVIQSAAVIESDVQSALFCSGLRTADEADFMAIWVRLTSTVAQADRNMLIDSLGCSQDPELLSLFLASSLATANVNYSTAERIRILNAAIQGGIVGVHAVLQFLDTNLLQAMPLFPLVSVVNNLTPWIGNPELMTQFEGLTTRMLTAGQITNEARNSAVQMARENLQWVDDYGTDITEWLGLYVDRATDGASSHVLSVILLLGTAIVSSISFY